MLLLKSSNLHRVLQGFLTGSDAINLPQVFTFGWREDIRVGDPMHTKKVCFDAISHNSPVTLYDCHGMKGNQLWRYRKVRPNRKSTQPQREFSGLFLKEHFKC